MNTWTVGDDDARRSARHEGVKREPAGQAEVESVAAGLKATAKAAETEGERQRARSMTRVSQVREYLWFTGFLRLSAQRRRASSHDRDSPAEGPRLLRRC